MQEWFQRLVDQFIIDFIVSDRYMLILNGLGVTILVSIVAIFLGLVLGLIISVIKVSYSYLGKGSRILWLLDKFCSLYLTVIRGTPAMLQLLIIYFVIFGSVNIPKVAVAILAFGINSGAYVAEIMRSGIMAVDRGQIEAGRSLGLSYLQTMRFIILPQAVKNILPALGNEFITLIKETSIVGYIALNDLTRAADIIRGVTYDAFMPLIAAALIYLAIVIFLTKMLGKLERRLRQGDTR